MPLSGGVANLLVPLTDEWVIGYGSVLKEDPERGECGVETHIIHNSIRVITKLPNSEQSYKGKVKTHKYINRQNQSTTGKL